MKASWNFFWRWKKFQTILWRDLHCKKVPKCRILNSSTVDLLKLTRGKWEGKMGNTTRDKRYSCTHVWLPIACTWDKVDILWRKSKLFREIAWYFKAATVTDAFPFPELSHQGDMQKFSQGGKKKKKRSSLRNWPQWSLFRAADFKVLDSQKEKLSV